MAKKKLPLVPTSVVGRLRFSIGLTAIILAVEVVGGLWANSLALLSDAGHVFTDLVALTLSWYAVVQEGRPANQRMTFGYHRVGILIAIVNGLTLVAIAGAIFYEAYRRFQNPEPVVGGLMLGVAVVGLLANLLVAFLLNPERGRNLNIRSAFLHVAGDALGSVGVIAGAVIIMATAAYWVDPAISVGIGLIIALGSVRIIKEGLAIFMEASPGHIDTAEIVRAMNRVPGVRDVHDLHMWTVGPQLHVLTCHVLVDDQTISQGSAIAEQLNRLLSEYHDIEHTTFQFECEECVSSDTLYCTLSPENSKVTEPEHHR